MKNIIKDIIKNIQDNRKLRKEKYKNDILIVIEDLKRYKDNINNKRIEYVKKNNNNNN